MHLGEREGRWVEETWGRGVRGNCKWDVKYERKIQKEGKTSMFMRVCK